MERSTVGIAFSALFVGLIVLLAGCMNPALSSEAERASAGISIQRVPENVDEIVLTITASDMDTVEERISAGDDEISIEVPVGPDRTFTAEAANGLYSTSVVRDVPAGGVNVLISFATNASVTVNFDFFTDLSSELDDYTLTVNGADMEEVSQTVSADDTSTTIDVPIGPDRTFNVVAPTTSSLDSAVLDYRGNSTVDVSSSGASVDVTLGIGETAILIPDPENSRLVQIDDMSGSGWIGTDQSLVGTIEASDVEVGPGGQIYAGGYYSQSESEGVYAFTSVNDPPLTIATEFYETQAVGIDGQNELLYYGGGGETPFLKQVSLGGESPAEVNADLSSFSSYGIWGITVGESGDLYVSGDGSDGTGGAFSGTPTVIKIDPNDGSLLWDTPTELLNVSSEQGSGQADVMYEDGKVLVTNPKGNASNRITVLDSDTGEVIDSFGSSPANPANPEQGELYGPRRFVATGNTMITVIDEYSDIEMGDYDRLVQFAPDGSDWETFGATGAEEGEFQFFLSATEPVN